MTAVNIRDLTPPQARLLTALVDADRGTRLDALGREVERLKAEVMALSALALRPRPLPRPQAPVTQFVEWRPNHRRVRDGGRHANTQRREIGVR